MKPVNKEILKDEIQWLLEAIDEQFDAIKSYDRMIPQIEFDIIMENIRKVYQNLHMLQNTEDPYTYFEEKIREDTVIKNMVTSTPNEEPSVQYVPDEVPEPVFKIQVDETEVVEQPAEPDPLLKKKPVRIQVQEPASDLDMFSDAGSGFTEKLRQAREKSFGHRTSQAKSDDLKSSININEKFLIINELFGGNLRDYNETIEKFNSFQDVKMAMEYLDLLRKKNVWDSGSGVFVRLKELVENKFA
jgi:hypothetical protein